MLKHIALGGGDAERLRRKFQREVESLRRLQHPSVVRLEGFFYERDSALLQLEWIPGGTLADWLREAYDLARAGCVIDIY